jgi:Tfp pilus tip-associated adhesin PilY1
MNKGNGKADQDFLGSGFKKLDSEIVKKNAPKINWGMKYQEQTDQKKIKYLEKLSATMNYAAFLIQEERNKLLELMEMKEAQLVSMSESLDANNEMIQQQITKMNAEKQEYHKIISGLNIKLREWENGDISRLGG